MSYHIPLFDDEAFLNRISGRLGHHYAADKPTGIAFDGPGAPDGLLETESVTVFGPMNLGVEVDQGSTLIVEVAADVDASYKAVAHGTRIESPSAQCRAYGFVEVVLKGGRPDDDDQLTDEHVDGVVALDLKLDLKLS